METDDSIVLDQGVSPVGAYLKVARFWTFGAQGGVMLHSLGRAFDQQISLGAEEMDRLVVAWQEFRKRTAQE